MSVHKMGCNSSKVQLPDAIFTDTYQPPLNAEIHNIQTATFTDLWFAMNDNDWAKKSEYSNEKFKERLHAYMKLHVCMEKHIVIRHAGRTWVFIVEYNESTFKNYRILTF
jgi:hypothetical protein